MNKFLKLAALFISLSPFTAHAELFNFSYTFSSGNVIAGSFDGILNGVFVDDISNVSASFNGTPFSGSPNLFHDGYSDATGFVNFIPAVVSTDAQLNNFLFIDSNYPSDTTYTNLFYMVNVPTLTKAVVSFTGFVDVDVYPNASSPGCPEFNCFDSSRWSLTTAIPEPETYAMLLAGLGLLGFVARRRKQQDAAAA